MERDISDIQRFVRSCDVCQKAVSKFEVGNKVLLMLSTEDGKLLLQWEGPYEVIEVVSETDYKIQIGNEVKVFHVNMMKRYWEREKPKVSIEKEVRQEGVSIISNEGTQSVDVKRDSTQIVGNGDVNKNVIGVNVDGKDVKKVDVSNKNVKGTDVNGKNVIDVNVNSKDVKCVDVSKNVGNVRRGGQDVRCGNVNVRNVDSNDVNTGLGKTEQIHDGFKTSHESTPSKGLIVTTGACIVLGNIKSSCGEEKIGEFGRVTQYGKLKGNDTRSYERKSSWRERNSVRRKEGYTYGLNRCSFHGHGVDRFSFHGHGVDRFSFDGHGVATGKHGKWKHYESMEAWCSQRAMVYATHVHNGV